MKNIETNVDRLKQQQAVLAVLGFYRGAIDGIWSAESISAKRQYEASGKFTGGIPNQGLPFDPSAPLPAPLYRDPRSGLVRHPELTNEKMQELMTRRGSNVPAEVKEPVVESKSSEEETPAEQTKAEPAPQESKPSGEVQHLSKREKRRQAIQQQNR